MHVNVKQRRLIVKWYLHISRRKEGYRYLSAINVIAFIKVKWFCGRIGLNSLVHRHIQRLHKSTERSHILLSRPSTKVLINSDRYKTDFNCKQLWIPKEVTLKSFSSLKLELNNTDNYMSFVNRIAEWNGTRNGLSGHI